MSILDEKNVEEAMKIADDPATLKMLTVIDKLNKYCGERDVNSPDYYKYDRNGRLLERGVTVVHTYKIGNGAALHTGVFEEFIDNVWCYIYGIVMSTEPISYRHFIRSTSIS